MPSVDVLMVAAYPGTSLLWGGCLCSDLGGVYVGKGGVSVAPPFIIKRCQETAIFRTRIATIGKQSPPDRVTKALKQNAERRDCIKAASCPRGN